MKKSDILFEVSWEVCNKVGGINTVISTKAKYLQEYTSELVMIGPDIWREHQPVSDFTEDKTLFEKWQHQAASEGLKITVGRWDIPTKPIVILVDFTDFFSEKNDIFREFWEDFKLDSLSGDWNYIEPAIFGYAAAKVIKSFHSFHFDLASKTIAHFHEWMTGTGVLFLKKNAPYIASVFTTHATLLGRTIAGNKMPFYGQLEKYNPELLARKLGLPSQYSLEKTAAQNADVFTTVSTITAEECKFLLKRDVDFVTTNGFNKGFVPPNDAFNQKRSEAKQTLKQVAEAVVNSEISDDAFYVLNSGRYEFTNKGVDIFIDALNEINNTNPQKEIIAFIMMPGNQNGPNKNVLERLQSKTDNSQILFSTHYLVDEQNDPVLNRIKNSKLDNSKNSKVKIIFSPVYLNKEDKVYNLSYYDLLIGFDLSVFPSFYEPWGYTPMESLAFAVPTITTDLAGFGKWLLQQSANLFSAFKVINRYHKEDSSVEQLKLAILDYVNFIIDMPKAQSNAIELSNLCLWDNMIENYYQAYDSALEYSNKRIAEIDLSQYEHKGLKFAEISTNEPKWKKIYVKQQLPDKLMPLQELANNLWWTWNHDAAVIFKSIDPQLWIEKKHNPVALIESLNTNQLNELQNNSAFCDQLYAVYDKFKDYMSYKPANNKDSIAYFSMEYGIHDTIKIFSGGLGILAGDYLKEASDANVNLKAVGLLYRYGYFKQRITALGDQISEFNAQKFTQLPLMPVRDENGNWVKIKLVLPTRSIYAKAWKLSVGRIDLFLLDTDIEENSNEDRKITYQLYGGNSENRFVQELILGVGGIRLLKQLNINSVHYHCNEGHAAFISVERLNQYIKNDKLDFYSALELVRSSTLFTTHTPVPAGHDRFEEDVIRKYIPHYPARLQLSWTEFMALGRTNEYDFSEKFNMSILAAKLSRNMNGVSKLHSEVSRTMFNNLYPAYYADELHIDYVTNGVHLPTWLAKKWFKLFKERLSKDFFSNQHNQSLWEKIYDIEAEIIWELRNHSRKKLIDYVKGRIKKEMTLRRESPQYLTTALYGLRDDVLTIGFARRFATYKRAYLLFKDLDRLNSIINDEDRPVQFLFAGKAHPADQAGKDIIKRIVEVTKMPQFIGKIIFLEDYDIALGKRLVQGVDVWLNNPTRPMEASGTSGEKASMNAVLNLSVLDGWWAEGYAEGAGWALSKEKDYDSQDLQDSLDASNLYYIIQEEIKSVFYTRNEDNIPLDWVKMMKDNLVKIAPRFTMNRMLNDYVDKFYDIQIPDFKSLIKNDFQKAKELSNWKKKVRDNWNAIEVIRITNNYSPNKALIMGESFELSVSLLLAELNPDDIGVEVVFGNKEGDTIQKIIGKHQLELKSFNAKRAIYSIKLPLSNAGVYDFSFRVYPKHSLLSHRMEFPYAKWI